MVRPAATLRRHLAEPLFRSAYSLMASTVLTAVLGLGFWIVAARAFPASVVGRDAALISAMVALSLACQLGGGNALLRFLPELGRAGARGVLHAYLVCTIVAIPVATAFALVGAAVAPGLRSLGDPLAALGFAFAVAAWGIFTLQDAALIAIRRASWTALENTAHGALKIVALPLLALAGVGSVFLAWVLPLVVVLPLLNLALFGRALPAQAARAPDGQGSLRSSSRGELIRFISQDYLGVIVSQASLILLPLIVVATLGSAANAYFYVAFTLVTVLDLLVYNAATSLTVEAAHRGRELGSLMRATARRLLAPIAAVALVVVVTAPLILLPFGPDYVDHGAPVLRLLGLAIPFRAATFLFDAACRVERRGGRIVATNAAGSALLLPLALLLSGAFGLTGIALAWLASAAIVGVTVAPLLARLLRRPSPRLGEPRREALPA